MRFSCFFILCQTNMRVLCVRCISYNFSFFFLFIRLWFEQLFISLLSNHETYGWCLLFDLCPCVHARARSLSFDRNRWSNLKESSRSVFVIYFVCFFSSSFLNIIFHLSWLVLFIRSLILCCCLYSAAAHTFGIVWWMRTSAAR